MSLQIYYQIRKEFSLTVLKETKSCVNKAFAHYGNF